jgi:hypothetical protein
VSMEGAIAVNRVGRYERLQQDFDDICSWLGLAQRPLPKINPTRLLCDPWPAYYDAETRDAVLRTHAIDFEKFGYSESLSA